MARRLLIFILSATIFIGYLASADQSPCAVEEASFTQTDGQLAESLRDKLSLESQLATEMVTRRERLTPAKTIATESMDSAGRATFLDQKLYEFLLAKEPVINRILADKDHLAQLEKWILVTLFSSPNQSFSSVVLVVAKSQNAPDLEEAASVFRRLENSRSWLEELQTWRAAAPAQEKILTPALEHVAVFQNSLREKLVASADNLAQFKMKIEQEERRLDQSHNREGAYKAQIERLDKRITDLKLALPALRKRVRDCTHRAQFGN